MYRVAWSNCFDHTLPSGHRFPMEKYTLLKEQLVYEGTLSTEQLFEPYIDGYDFLETVHGTHYIQELTEGSITRKKMRAIGFPYSKALHHREIMIARGTCQCVDFALENGIACNLAGGTHHAFRDRGEGFCLYNDQALAAMYFLEKAPQSRVLILDLDVHQGNGTAAVFKDESRVTTVSLHGAHNYPLYKEASDWDIPLADGITDKEYLEILQGVLEQLQQKTFDVMFFQAGVDILCSDKLGRLGISLEGCKQRDEQVFAFAHRQQLPIVVTMGGGYSPNIRDIVEAHANTFRVANQFWY